MIEVSHLSKSYGSLDAVRDLSFSVDRHEVVGFLGPNGAGKSTTLRILAGFLGMTAGTVRIDGHDIVDEPTKARAAIGYMPEATPLYGEMRVAEYLAFRAELKGVARKQRRDLVDRAMREAHVADRATQLISSLSKGYRQRVGLADALVARPPILILDEPTAGLDPNQIREVRDLVVALGKEHTILVSTHILSEVEATCTRALVIAKGQLVASGKLDELRAMRVSKKARVVVRGKADEVEKQLRAALAKGEKPVKVLSLVADGEIATAEISAKKDQRDLATTLEDVTAALVAGGLRVREITPLRAGLDDVFSELTEDHPKAEPEADEAAEAS